ncbi:MAG: pilus assembly protein [Actinomycetota bacterium]|nr:pilus assembly protein [Actinomycetota bacterium]
MTRLTLPVAGERGSATVEFALVLPMVMVMILAVLQVGLLVKDQLIVVGAARAGAREAAVSPDDGRAREAAVNAAATLRSDQIEVDVRRDGGVGTAVAVTVLYRASAVVPFVEWLFPGTIELRGAATMRQETE